MIARFGGRCVCFDIDGTLFDRERAQREMAMRLVQRFPHALRAFPRERVEEAFLESDRISTERFVFQASPWEARVGRTRIFLSLLGVSYDLAEEMTGTYLEEYPAIDAAIPGARETVLALHERYRLGVISNGLPDVQHEVIS